MKSISFPCPLIEKLSYSSCEIRIFIKADSTNEAFSEKGKKKRATIKIVSFISAPGKPSIVPEDCSAENNSVTIAWQPHMGKVVESYSLELDDGCGGDFRVRVRETGSVWSIALVWSSYGLEVNGGGEGSLMSETEKSPGNS